VTEAGLFPELLLINEGRLKTRNKYKVEETDHVRGVFIVDKHLHGRHHILLVFLLSADLSAVAHSAKDEALAKAEARSAKAEA
jgi:hypothetical protein